MRYLFFVLALFLFQCSSENPFEGESKVGDVAAYEEPTTVEQERVENEIDIAKKNPTKIIKSGNISFEVDSIQKAQIRINEIVKRFDGYIEKESLEKYGFHKKYSLTIRVPQIYFDSLVIQLENKNGKLISKNISSIDVTEEYFDLNIRLENSLAYIQQYRELLKKTKSIKDILEIQEIIRVLEEEIESKKGRIRFINNQVSFSTLNVVLTEYSEGKIQKDSFFHIIGMAFNNGYQALLVFIIGLINLWPFLILLGLFIGFRKKIFGLVRSKK